MKLQCGLLHFDHQPATPDDSGRLLGGLSNPPEDIHGTLVKDSVVMIYRGNRITKEEDMEIQPFRLGSCSLTWDGRLDNRRELADRTGIRDETATPDPAIVLQAYEMFGESVFATLVGEFALVLWCSKTQTLRFARSACGARTLYYVAGKNTLTWSSNFAHLVRVTGVDLTVNDDYVAEYLVSQPSASSSPLTNVGVIPPNHLVEFTHGSFKHYRELWNPTHFASVHHRSDGEYEEHFREVLREAVSVRLRADQPVFSELSGGLDSSTIVLMADRILREKHRPPGDLQTTSCVYERSETCDERRFIQLVEERRGINSHLVHERDQRITLGLSDSEFTGLPNALHCFPGRFQKVAAQMSAYNAHVLLTGRGGDHLFWSEADGTPLVADEICHGNMMKAHSACSTWSHAASAPYYELFVKKAFPLAFDSWFPGRSGYKAPALPAWLHSRFHKRLSMTPGFTWYSSWRSAPSRRAQLFNVEHMFRYLGSGLFHEYGDLYVSHPYSHRPLIEFCLGTPVSQFLRNGETRSLMRRALRDLLPAKTVKRVSKGLLDEAITRALQAESPSDLRLSDWQICERKYVEQTRFMETLKLARLGIADLTGPLLRLFSLERWLRSLSHVRVEKKSEPVVPSWPGLFLRFERS